MTDPLEPPCRRSHSGLHQWRHIVGTGKRACCMCGYTQEKHDKNPNYAAGRKRGEEKR